MENVSEPQICGTCGILQAEDRTSCETCGDDYPSTPPRAASQPHGGYWVAVRARFTCNACRFDTPLNHFELGDGVLCMRCGLEQKYPRHHWNELVDFAHGVGDLTTGGPEGRHPDPQVSIERLAVHRRLGKTTSWVDEDRRRASPGNPLCASCRAPLVVAGRGEDQLVVACSKCEARRHYEIPATAASIERLIGVVAEEHEAAGHEVMVKETNGVTVLSCPSCGADLDVQDTEGITRCAFCDACCRISMRSHARVGHRETPMKTWWLYFEGPSRKRAKLTKRRRREIADAEKAQPRATERDFATKPTGTNKRGAAIAVAVFVGVGGLLAALMVMNPSGSKETTAPGTDAKYVTGASVLEHFTFNATPAQLAELLEVPTSNDMSRTFFSGGTITDVRVRFGSAPTYAITLGLGPLVNTKAVENRFREVAGPTLAPDDGLVIAAPETHLSVEPRAGGRLEVSTTAPGERGKTVATTLWSAAWYVLFGHPKKKPTADQLRVIRGEATP